jgi:MoaE-MoaD fusion protein
MQRVHVSVLLFAGLRERAGVDRVEVELPDGAVVGDVLAAMGETPVGPIGPRQCVVAVNREYAGAEEPVREGDEVALVPPVSGGAADPTGSTPVDGAAARTRSRGAADPTGSTPVDGAAARTRSRGATGAQALRRARVTGEALDLGALAAAVRDPRAGAVVLFEGVTREVDELRYEAYAEMAEPRLAAIAAEEAERHGLCAVAVEHRTGAVALGEPSVIVAASAPHRGEAFAGARAVIDRVKAEAPIWKQEVTDAGTRRVEGTLPPAP